MAPKRSDPAQFEAPQPSLIRRGLRIQGNLKSTGEVRIDGTVEGDIKAATITVGEKGSITGNVVADAINVHGFVQGDIGASIVRLMATAHTIGNTTHGEISVEKGACIVGNFKRTRQDEVGPGVLPNNLPAVRRRESGKDDA